VTAIRPALPTAIGDPGELFQTSPATEPAVGGEILAPVVTATNTFEPAGAAEDRPLRVVVTEPPSGLGVGDSFQEELSVAELPPDPGTNEPAVAIEQAVPETRLPATAGGLRVIGAGNSALDGAVPEDAPEIAAQSTDSNAFAWSSYASFLGIVVVLLVLIVIVSRRRRNWRGR
jgi:hypothetical protein